MQFYPSKICVCENFRVYLQRFSLQMATKINIVQQNTIPTGVLTSAFLAQCGISRSEQVDYVRSGWLERIAQGVYCFKGNTPTLYATLFSYAEQMDWTYHVGAYAALEVFGYAHYVAMQEVPIHIFTHKDKMAPQWMIHYPWGRTLHNVSTTVLGDNGIEKRDVEGITLQVSSPERAFMECLLFAPEQYALMDLYYIMEMLNTLRPKVVQQLLEECSSVKVKRLFLYMAEKANHPWYKVLKTENIDLGTGTRSFQANGKTVAKYKIVLPQELVDYE